MSVVTSPASAPASRGRSFSRGFDGLRSVILVLFGFVVAGCEPQVALTGLVTDINGAALPGVSVKVKSTEYFSVTNGNGIFGERPGRLPVSPGTWDLRYIKTGFTTAEQRIETDDGRRFEAPTVVLWPLPSARGIYEWSEGRYREWTRVEPERHLREDRSPVFGIRQVPELDVVAALDKIVGHKLPPYDWRMSRLEQVSVLRDGGEENATDTVWAESVHIPVHVVPLDEPERLLWEIRPVRALGPGVYAIHWGALEGDGTTATSAYIVSVTDPAAQQAEAKAAPTIREREMPRTRSFQGAVYR
jgi:hypothetical protein